MSLLSIRQSLEYVTIWMMVFLFFFLFMIILLQRHPSVMFMPACTAPIVRDVGPCWYPVVTQVVLVSSTAADSTLLAISQDSQVLEGARLCLQALPVDSTLCYSC